MKIAWVQDIGRPHGGAENSNRTVVREGSRMGFDIVGVTPENFWEQVLAEADCFVINNFHQFFPWQVRAILSRIWDDKVPYVVYSHDHRDLGRPYLFRDLLRRSALNVFISPRHKAAYQSAYNCGGIALPLAIDVDLFRPVGAVEREKDTALVVGGWVRGGKTGSSLHAFVRENPHLRFLSVGFPMNGANAKVLPHRPLETMPAVYTRVDTLVHLPDFDCAGERVVFEAALCGVRNFHLNERVGHASWGFDLTDTAHLRMTLAEAPRRFWTEVRIAAAGKSLVEEWT